MTIREATYSDVPAAVELIRRFQADSGVIPSFDYAKTEQTVFCLISSETNALFLAEAGDQIIGGLGITAAPHFWTSELSATELFWYVAPEHRGNAASRRLFTAAEKWATEKGCVEFVMGALASSPDTVHRFYERKGFSASQTSYVKRIIHAQPEAGTS